MEYKAILIDPPWHFSVRNEATGAGRSASRHYPTMTLDDLKALPLHKLMAADCCLFLWIIWSMLPQALELGAAWGLVYKTCAFDWSKVVASKAGQQTMGLALEDDRNWHMGMGYWTRANTEPCLLFTRGNPKRKGRGVRQLVVSAVRRHSQKPDCVHQRIEQLVEGPYLEIFARQPRPGWDAIGNGIDNRDIRDVLENW